MVLRHVRSLCKDANGIKQIDYIEYAFVTPKKTLPVLKMGLLIHSVAKNYKSRFMSYRIVLSCRNFLFSGRELYLGVMLGVQPRPLHVKVEFKSRSPLEIDDFTQMLRKDKIKGKKLPKSDLDILLSLRQFKRV